MPTFISFLDWTEQGLRNVKEAPQRAEAAKALLRSMGGEMKAVYVTSGDQDLVAIFEVPDDDTAARFALAVAMQGNVRTRSVRAWTQEEFARIVSSLP